MTCSNCDKSVSSENEHKIDDQRLPARLLGWTCIAHDWRGEALKLRERAGELETALEGLVTICQETGDFVNPYDSDPYSALKRAELTLERGS